MDPAVKLDNLSNLTVGCRASLQYSSVITYLAVISLVHRRHEILRRSVIPYLFAYKPSDLTENRSNLAKIVGLAYSQVFSLLTNFTNFLHGAKLPLYGVK